MPCGFQARRPYPFLGLGSGCQFAEDPDHPSVESEGARWCRFHLPLDASGADGVCKADWAAEAVAAFNDAVFAHIDAAKAAGEGADLTGVVFPGIISFDRFRGEENALPAVTFVKAHFGDDADFSEAHFGGDANFSEAHFGSGAFFREVHFGNIAFFREAHFGSVTYFTGAHFGSVASFREAHFGSVADFGEAHFDSDADFSGAAEDGGTGERREAVALESGPGEAGKTVTTGAVTVPAREARSDFRWAGFSRTRFDKSAIFSNRRFTDTTKFDGATFHVAPEFHNAVLHQDTDFTGAVFRDRSGNAAPAYRTLKLAMEQVRARDEEGMFYALEMESRRRRADTPRAVKLFSLLYEAGSDYGRSLARPLVLLGGVTFLFYLLYAALGTDGREAYPGAPLRLAMEQIVRPFALLTVDYARAAGYSEFGRWALALLERAPVLLPALAAIQSLASLGLIALFLLALRRRFRMV